MEFAVPASTIPMADDSYCTGLSQELATGGVRVDTIGQYQSAEAEREARRRIEGVERIPLLESAEFVALTVGTEPEEPVTVFIGWYSELTERPYPGTAIWRAAVERFLRAAPTGNSGERQVRIAAEASLDRFPSLDRWLTWADHERPVARSRPAQPSRAFWVGRLPMRNGEESRARTSS
jgi:hypothetical protein